MDNSITEEYSQSQPANQSYSFQLEEDGQAPNNLLLKDEEIKTDASDAQAVSSRPRKSTKRKEMLTLRVDRDVLDYFKSMGKGYTTRMNNVLRDYMQEQMHSSSISNSMAQVERSSSFNFDTLSPSTEFELSDSSLSDYANS